MSATLSYDLKKCMNLLAQDGRWNVLTVLILHANIRNRCFVSITTIAGLAANGNRNRVNRAKKWLEDHGAFELVPVAKRVDDELKLPPNQHVYQLTGAISQCTMADCECHRWPVKKLDYLHYGAIENITVETNEILPNNINGETVKSLNGDNINGETLSTTIISKRSSAPKKGAVSASKTREPNPMYDAILKVWKYTAFMNGLMAKMLNGTATKAGWKEYNLEQPITPPELIEWSGWYRRTVLKGNPDLNMVEEHVKIQSSITFWQMQKQQQIDKNAEFAKAEQQFAGMRNVAKLVIDHE